MVRRYGHPASGVCERPPVTAFTRTGSGWSQTTIKGQVTAGKVILANNGRPGKLGASPRTG